MRAIEGICCPHCGGPLTFEAFPQSNRDGRVVLSIPSADALHMCVRCVSLVLCMATVAIHGDVGERPQSHHFPGHDERMRDHEERMRQMGLVNDFDTELADEALAAVPA